MTYVIGTDWAIEERLGLEFELTDKYDPKKKFEWEDSAEAVDVNRAPEGFIIYRRPFVDWRCFDWSVVVRNKKRMDCFPDLYVSDVGVLVSEEVKGCIERFDSVNNQFWPATITLGRGGELLHRKHYWMKPRIYVKRPKADRMETTNVSISSAAAKKIICLIQSDRRISSLLEKYDVWHDYFGKSYLFVSDRLMELLLESGVKGISVYDAETKSEGVVSHV